MKKKKSAAQKVHITFPGKILIVGFGSIGTTISGLTIDPLARATGLDKTGVGEVLGLGKTYMAAMLARDLI